MFKDLLGEWVEIEEGSQWNPAVARFRHRLAKGMGGKMRLPRSAGEAPPKPIPDDAAAKRDVETGKEPDKKARERAQRTLPGTTIKVPKPKSRVVSLAGAKGESVSRYEAVTAFFQ
jgi:hypothetical protein